MHSLVISERVIVMRTRNIFIMDTSHDISRNIIIIDTSLQDVLKHLECRLVFSVNPMAAYFRPMVASIIVSK